MWTGVLFGMLAWVAPFRAWSVVGFWACFLNRDPDKLSQSGGTAQDVTVLT